MRVDRAVAVQADMDPKLIATVTGLYPLILLVAPILATALEILPRPFAVLGSTLCMVLMMTYAVMPLVTRVLSRWLYTR